MFLFGSFSRDFYAFFLFLVSFQTSIPLHSFKTPIFLLEDPKRSPSNLSRKSLPARIRETEPIDIHKSVPDIHKIQTNTKILESLLADLDDSVIKEETVDEDEDVK